MRNKKNFSFDEEKDAVEIIRTGFPNGIIDSSKMYLVAKYYRHTFNYGAIRLERELIGFCKTQDPNFNPVTEAETIKKWVASAMTYDLRKIGEVCITQKEIEFLKTITVSKDRKLLFMTLVLSKALKKRNTRIKRAAFKTSNNYYIRYSNFLDIVRLAQIKNMSEVGLSSVFHKYKDNFILYAPEKELLRIKFIDGESTFGIPITNLENPLEYYNILFETDGTTLCANCGNPIIKKSNRQKLCENCAKIEKRKQKRTWWRENMVKG
jgi:hypothetical protein